ncbi:MAG: hypothetical protein AB7G36_14015 [Candidatus Nanopelagicales bacterium]
MSEDDRWAVLHFAQANPAGEGQGSVPALLRRVADSIDELGAVQIQDVVFHGELDDDGRERPTVTVYYLRA